MSGKSKTVLRMSKGEKSFAMLNMFLLAVLAVLALYPFVYVLSMSLSSAAEASKGGLHLYPREVSLMAYQMVLKNPEIVTGYLNTLFRTVVGTALTLLVSCLTAYPLSRKNLPYRGIFTFLILFTMIFSGGMIPRYLVVKSIGLMDNRWVYILPVLTTAFNIVILKGFFQSIPESLEESAQIDGAGPLRILFQIYVPLSKPVLATVGLMTAVMHWNMWFDALIYVNSDSKQVLQSFLRRIVIEGSTDLIEKGIVNPDTMTYTAETIKAATIIITILPVLFVYPFAQKYFVKGITLGGVKE